MNIVEREVDKLIPYSKNAKKHDEAQISNVAESIKQFGFVQPVVVDKNGVIVIGHCRTLAAKKLGMKTVPCVMVDISIHTPLAGSDLGTVGVRRLYIHFNPHSPSGE